MIPKIEYPVFTVNLPITGSEVTFRPMTMREEKILLTAQESKDIVNIMDAMMVCLTNCQISELDLKKIPWIDLQYFFLYLRSKSVGKIATLLITDEYDPTKTHKVQIDIENVEIKNTDQPSKIFLTDTTGIITRHPLFKHVRLCNKQTDGYLVNLYYIRGCIQAIFNEEEVFGEENFTDQELIDYIENLTPEIYGKISQFVDQSPKIEYVVQYQNSKEERKTTTFDTLQNFF